MDELDKITTPEQLLTLLKRDMTDDNINIEKLRYAIYLRKSTDDPDKQIRSIEDQLAECKKMAHDNKLLFLDEDIVEEKESAKYPNIRPKFRKLLDRIIAGELDGIISWHPNRLSRNMREAGEIIDLLDTNVIKDLKFASHTFINDSSGKMLLGIVFVMAKQYSDQLSADVKRGNDKNIEAGFYINKAKHGYCKDNNKRLQPDGNNFAIIKEAFQMRLKGDTLDFIAKFVNDAGYTRKNASDGKTINTKFKKQTLVKIFKDSVYTGILKYGEKTIVNLMDLYDFTPMISVTEYLKINKYNSYDQAFKFSKSKKNQEDKIADFLSDKVYCSICGEETQAGISKGKTKKYYYFRCTTIDCERFNVGTRAKVILDFVYDFLSKKPFTSQKAFSSYRQEIVRLQNQGLADLNSQINSAKRSFGLDSDDINNIKTNIAKETDHEVREIQRAELKRLEDKTLATQSLINKLISKKTNISNAPLTFEEFTFAINAVEKELKEVQSTTELNRIVSKIFLNFTVLDKSVEKYKLNPPFDTLFETKVSHGAR